MRVLLTPSVPSATRSDPTEVVRAEWRGVVLAESAEVRTASGYVYFPPKTVRWEHLEPTGHRSTCRWKGVATYFDVVVDGGRNANAAWTYPDPLPQAEDLAGWVAFWNGVQTQRR